MPYSSSTDPAFLATLERWLGENAEILVVFRPPNTAGGKEFEFFTSFSTLAMCLADLSGRTWIDAWRQPQLPMRGIVDDQFISSCLARIPGGTEYLVVETEPRTYDYGSWIGRWAASSSGDATAT